ncbi:hypothetical protein DENSPDRAFT_881485 [Dentipellis sp. KUC8613]|nr:hypothetical protein DENSPDRAFT_881485 [Dentipellis sp. KUC8613]
MTTAYVKAAGRTSISPSPARFPITRQQPFGSGNLDTSAQNTPAKPPAAEKPVLKVATGGLAGAAASQPVFGKPGWSAGASPSSAKGTATPARSGPSTPSAQGTSIFTGTSSTTAVSAKPPSRAPPLASDAHGGGSPNVAASAPKAATAPSNAPPALVAEKPAQRERETGGIIGGTAINQPMFGKPGWSVIASPTSTKSTAAPTTSATTSHTVFAPASSSTGAPTAPGSSSVVDTTLAPATSSVPQPNTDVPPTLKQPPSTSWLVPAEGPSHALHAVSADAHPAQHVLSHERILKWTSILESAKKAKDDADRALAVATEEVTRKRKREDEVTERLVRLRTEAPGSHLGEAESKPDVLDAVAALEAQVNEMRTVLMIERSARQAAEQTLASERRVLEDVRRECREPFVVPALLDAFIKLSRMGEGAMEVTMEVDEQIVS